ncbi:MAG: VCBS repeat-containing protein [Myxococcota bacterium]
MRIGSALLWIAVCSCTLELESLENLTADQAIACVNDMECPSGLTCSSGGFCFSRLENFAPAATLTVDSGTLLDDIRFTLSAFDVNTDDTLTLEVRYGFAPDATDQIASLDRTSFPATPENDDGYTVTWNALLDASTEGSGLTKFVANLTGEDTVAVPTDATAPPFRLRRATLYLAATVTDTAGAGSSTTKIGPLTVGSEPPALVVTVRDPPVFGTFGIDVAIADGDLLPTTVEVEFKERASDAEWRVADMVPEDTVELAPRTNPYALRWRSLTARADSPQSPQGVGVQNLTDVVVRARATEAIGGGLQYGDWAESAPFAVQNQVPPAVVNAEPVNIVGEGAQGVVAVAFTLVDQQAERIDLQFDFSDETTDVFRPATEFPDDESCGAVDLASTAAADGGVRHVFLWDAWFDLGGDRHLGRLRISPVNRSGVAGDAVVVSLGPIGESLDRGTGRDLSASSPGFFASPELVAGTSRPARLSDDGVLDLVAISRAANPSLQTLFTLDLEGSGGALEFNSSLPMYPGAVHFDIGRYDSDDFDDLVSVTFDGTLELRRGTGSTDDILEGDAEPSLAIGLTPLAVGAGDFDGDGNADAAVLTSGVVHIYPGDGTTLLDAPREVAQAGIRAMDIGDGDGDGMDDIWVTDADGNLFVLAGTTRVVSADPLTLAPALMSISVGTPWVVDDFNGDGQADISSAGNSSLTQWHARPGGVFADGLEEVWRLDSADTSALISGDFDADGLADLIRWSSARVDVHRSSVGRGTNPFIEFSHPVFLPCLTDVAFADFDGDGLSEGVGSQTDENCDELDNNLVPVFPFPRGFDVVRSNISPLGASRPDLGSEHVGLWDLDRDGVGDRVWLKGGGIGWQYGLGFGGIPSGRFGSVFTRIANEQDTLDALFVEDFNGDGFRDVIAFVESAATKLLFFSGGREGFADAVEVSWNGTAPVAAGDWNSDGLTDLVSVDGIYDSSATVIGVEFNPRPLSFADIERNGGEVRMTPTHLDFDGRLDLVVFGRGDGTGLRMEALLGDGTSACPGSCGLSCGSGVSGIGSLASARRLAATDLDGDGRMDAFGLARSNTTDVSIVVRRGQSADTCGPYPEIGNEGVNNSTDNPSFPALPIAAGDVDLDGDQDVYYNDYASGLRLRTDVDAAGVPSIVRESDAALLQIAPPVPTDVNRDGRPDVVGSAAGNGAAVVLTGQATSQWDSSLRPAAAVIGLGSIPNLAVRPTTSAALYREKFIGDLHDEAAVWVREANLPELNGFGDWEFLTPPLNVSGDRRFMGVGTGRFEVLPRLGGPDPRSPIGLDMDDPSNPRGVVIRLSRKPKFVGASLSSLTVVVLIRVRDYERAVSVPDDIASGSIAMQPTWLPTVMARGQEQLQLTERYDWLVVPQDGDNDILTGTGNAWVEAGDDILVRTDQLGDMLVLVR